MNEMAWPVRVFGILPLVDHRPFACFFPPPRSTQPLQGQHNPSLRSTFTTGLQEFLTFLRIFIPIISILQFPPLTPEPCRRTSLDDSRCIFFSSGGESRSSRSTAISKSHKSIYFSILAEPRWKRVAAAGSRSCFFSEWALRCGL